jgi:hypothetical protein
MSFATASRSYALGAGYLGLFLFPRQGPTVNVSAAVKIQLTRNLAEEGREGGSIQNRHIGKEDITLITFSLFLRSIHSPPSL